MYSLQKKLTRNLIVNLVVVMIGLLILLHLSTRHLVESYILTRLQHDAESLISVIEFDRHSGWHVEPSYISTIYNRVRSGHYYQIEVGEKLIRSRSLFDFDFPISRLALNENRKGTIEGPGDELWLVWHQAIEKNGEVIQIQVAEDIIPVQNQLLKYTLYAFLLVAVVTLLLLYLQKKALNKAFHVFEVLRQNMSMLRKQGSIDEKGIVPLEISPLAREIELLVEQLKQRIKRTRHAISNLAHEIKRPLQVLSLQQDELNEQSGIKAVEDIKDIVDRELRRAKISGSHSVGGHFNARDEIPVMLEIMKKIYPHVEVQEDMDSSVIEVGLDRDDLLELIGNLLDNACKFARSKVIIQLRIIDDILQIIMEDDGKGVSEDKLSSIVNRGVRLDESEAGHGLGLGICRDIIDSYSGQLELLSSRLGGLEIVIKIPINR